MPKERYAGNCTVCGSVIDQQVLDEWCAAEPPFCWECGSYYFEEGHRRGLTPQQALATAEKRRTSVATLIRSLDQR